MGEEGARVRRIRLPRKVVAELSVTFGDPILVGVRCDDCALRLRAHQPRVEAGLGDTEPDTSLRRGGWPSPPRSERMPPWAKVVLRSEEGRGLF